MKTVSREEIASAVGIAANQAADGVPAAAILRGLSSWLAPDEAIGLVKLLTSDRIRCQRCNCCVTTARASGEHCRGCAAEIRYEAEAQQYGRKQS
jgi:hypothetical protein